MQLCGIRVQRPQVKLVAALTAQDKKVRARGSAQACNGDAAQQGLLQNMGQAACNAVPTAPQL